MYRKTSNHSYTASLSKANRVVVMYDDGAEDILSYRADFDTEAEALAYLAEEGFEVYDPNAALKAAGLVWNGSCYAAP